MPEDSTTDHHLTWTEAMVRELRDAVAENPPRSRKRWVRICAALSFPCSRESARTQWRYQQSKPASFRQPEPTGECEITTRADGRQSIKYTGRIGTVTELLEHHGIDARIWKVDRHRVKAYEGFHADGRGGHVVVPMHSISATLVRKIPENVTQAFDAVLADWTKRKPPKRGKIAKQKRPRRVPHLALIGLTDHHFGKRAWPEETGNGYDLRTAETIFANAVEDSLAYLSSVYVEEAALFVGSDFFHTDTPQGTTTGGTPVDSDDRWQKVYRLGANAMRAAVDRVLEEIGKVTLLWLPGNHDRLTSYTLAHALKWAYQDDPRVVVDMSPPPRKYLAWRGNLIGAVHGDHVRQIQRLPGLMALERSDYSTSISRTWFRGHLHTSKSDIQWSKLRDEADGCAIWTLPSLAAHDAWHSAQPRYATSERACEVHVWRAEVGHAGFFRAWPRV